MPGWRLKLAIAWSAPKVPVVLHQKTQMDLSRGGRRNFPIIKAGIPTETLRVTRLLVITAGLRSSCINAFVVGLSWTAAPTLSTVECKISNPEASTFRRESVAPSTLLDLDGRDVHQKPDNRAGNLGDSSSTIDTNELLICSLNISRIIQQTSLRRATPSKCPWYPPSLTRDHAEIYNTALLEAGQGRFTHKSANKRATMISISITQKMQSQPSTCVPPVLRSGWSRHSMAGRRCIMHTPQTRSDKFDHVQSPTWGHICSKFGSCSDKNLDHVKQYSASTS
ncbi:hypothetical protein BDR22DRAFT_822564 [Usnea florida]